MPATRPAPFSSEFLAQLERLTLLSRRTFRGRVRGERRSPRRGHSVEFCDYRAYGVGDDLRYVDWNIYGRLDRLHVKLFVDEEDLCLHLLLDASASMDFGAPTKLEYGARLAAALGFVGLVGMERVGVGVLRERVAEGWSPTRGRPALGHALAQHAHSHALHADQANEAERGREPRAVLELRRRAEVHRRRGVQEEVQAQVLLVHEELDVEPVEAPVDVPVDVAEVVTYPVGAVVAELDAVPAA